MAKGLARPKKAQRGSLELPGLPIFDLALLSLLPVCRPALPHLAERAVAAQPFRLSNQHLPQVNFGGRQVGFTETQTMGRFKRPKFSGLSHAAPRLNRTFALRWHFRLSLEKIPFGFNAGTAEIGENGPGEDLASFLRHGCLACCC